MKLFRWALPVKSMKNRGFTIVELLVVIVVIVILAAITVVTYTNIQSNARGMAMINDFKNIEDAFRLFSVREGYATWPKDNDPGLTGAINPNIADIIANPNSNFSKYLPSIDAAKSSGVTGLWYMYDNDNDTYGGCSASDTRGVNILVQGKVPQDIAQYIDDTLDDGDLSCGSVTYITSSKYLQINISKDSTL